MLSAGHACLLQYLFLHFSGYETWTLDAVKQYHAPIKGNIAAGHPEIEVDGVEVSQEADDRMHREDRREADPR